jgi:transposase
MSYKTGADRNQRTLLPEYLEDYITEENPVRFFDAFVNTLDMKQCGFLRFVPAAEGRPGYNPKDMLKLYVYGYFNRIRSSRSLMKEAHRNLEVMWLINKLTPDFRTISDFRKNNAKALKEVFKAFNRFCDSLGLYSKELFAVDGSKFKAVNSKDNNFTLPKLDERIKRLDAQIDEYMKLIETTDAAEHDELAAALSVPKKYCSGKILGSSITISKSSAVSLKIAPFAAFITVRIEVRVLSFSVGPITMS